MVVSNILCFHPFLGKIPSLTNIFQMGWNHQLENVSIILSLLLEMSVLFLKIKIESIGVLDCRSSWQLAQPRRLSRHAATIFYEDLNWSPWVVTDSWEIGMFFAGWSDHGEVGGRVEVVMIRMKQLFYKVLVLVNFSQWPAVCLTM